MRTHIISLLPRNIIKEQFTELLNQAFNGFFVDLPFAISVCHCFTVMSVYCILVGFIVCDVFLCVRFFHFPIRCPVLGVVLVLESIDS